MDYPSRPVTIVVPLLPGGAADILARGVAEKLQTYTGHTFLVQNTTGGGTMLAAESEIAPRIAKFGLEAPTNFVDISQHGYEIVETEADRSKQKVLAEKRVCFLSERRLS